jgi:hypothetical protein
VAKAVKYAERAVQLSGGRNPAYLDTLAAAYAEAGRFPEAVSTAQKALDLAEHQNRAPLVDGLNTRIKLYESQQPYHDVMEGAQWVRAPTRAGSGRHDGLCRSEPGPFAHDSLAAGPRNRLKWGTSRPVTCPVGIFSNSTIGSPQKDASILRMDRVGRVQLLRSPCPT